MSFTDKVRRSRVKHPTQRGFSIHAWNKALGNRNTDERDQQLHQSGILLFEELEEVRRRLRAMPSLEPGFDVRILTGHVNREYKVIIDSIQPSPEVELLFSSEAAEAVRLIGPGKSPVRLAGAVESLVDSVRFPFGFGSRSDEATSRHVEDIKELGSLLQLGMTYHILEQQWLRCLWEGYFVERRGDVLCVRSSNEARDTRIAIAAGQHRFDVLSSEFTSRSISMLMNPEHRWMREMAVRETPAAHVDSRGRVKFHVWGPRSDIGDSMPPPSRIHTSFAQELYWDELLVEPLPKFGELTVRQLMDVWHAVAAVGASLEAQLPSDTAVPDIRDLARRFGRIVRTSDLSRRFKKIGLSSEEAAKAIEVLQMPRDVRADPWLHPLVPCDDGRNLSVFLPVSNTANFIRLIEHWLTAGGIDMSRRGRMFEDYARSALARQIEDSPLRKDMWISDRSVFFPDKKTGEEIDIIVRLGKTFLIVECKCCAFPTGSLSFHQLYDAVREGRDQAKRKAAVCEGRAKDFAQEILGDVDAASFTFVPVVLCNLPLAAPFVDFSEPGVTDLYLITKYIREGEIGLMRVFHRDSGLGPAQQTIALHTDLETAEANIGHFLRCSPLIELYRNAVRRNEWEIPLASDRVLSVEDWFVDPDALREDVVNVKERWKARTGSIAQCPTDGAVK